MKVTGSQLARRKNLHGEKSTRATLALEIKSDLIYTPGDHVGVCPMNQPELVTKIIERLSGVEDPDATVELQILKESHTSNGT